MTTLFEVDFSDKKLVEKRTLAEPTELDRALLRLQRSVAEHNTNRWRKLRDDDRWTASFDAVNNELWLERRGFGTTSCFHVSSFGDLTFLFLRDHTQKYFCDRREATEHSKEALALLPKLSAHVSHREVQDG